MAIVRKYLIKDGYTKADNNIVRSRYLTDASKCLYWFMASFRNAFQLNDLYIEKSLGWSRRKIARCKKQLKESGLIHIEKIDRVTYFLYIGSSDMNAIEVMKNWNKLEK